MLTQFRSFIRGNWHYVRTRAKKNERTPVITYTLRFDNEIYLPVSVSVSVCVICRQFVWMWDWCSFVHTDRFPNENVQMEKKFHIYINADTDTFIYSQMIFIFISNTSIDIFCSFRVAFTLSASLCRLPCYFYAIEISGIFFLLFLLACGWFYSELMRRMRTNTNVLNCTMYTLYIAI